jgi:hypothetical protein
VLARLPSSPGRLVRVRGSKGEWRIMGKGKDGSVTLFGGPRRQWRSVRPEQLRPLPRRVRKSQRSRTRPKPDPPTAP